jgi:tripartite-type tricarboxylate transporter receptor subunit TctC
MMMDPRVTTLRLRLIEMKLRLALFALFLAGAAMCAPATVSAQVDYPERTVRIIVPHPAGGSTDVVTRIVAEKAQAVWGKPIVLDNVVGAAGTIATTQGAKAAADGYTMTAIVSTTTTLLASLKSSLPYDPLHDFQPLVLFGTFPNVLVVRRELGPGTVSELIALLKASPGKYTYASTGYGSTTHIAAEWFKQESRTDILHVPFTGSSAALPALLGGHVDMMFDVVATMWPQVQDGSLVALGTASRERLPFAPDLPAIAETLPGFDVSSWIGLALPAGTPAAIVQKAAAGILQAMQDGVVIERMKSIGAVANPKGPDAFRTFMQADYDKWRRVIKDNGIKVEN